MRPPSPASRAAFAAALLLAPVCVLLSPVQAQTWQGPNPGEWNVPANWSTGIVPDASGATVTIANPSASATTLAIGLAGAPFTIGRINASTTHASGVISVGDAASGSDTLVLDYQVAQPIIQVGSGTLRMLATLQSTGGFNKTGNATLSFRDNPHPQPFTGAVRLTSGTLEIGADQDLGASSNGLSLVSNATLAANPLGPAQPVVLGATRGIGGTGELTLTNASDTGSLEIAGPITIAGNNSIRFSGTGSLTLSGTNTQAGNITYSVWPVSGATAQTRESNLKFVGPGAVRAAGNNLLFDLGNATITNSSTLARVDLGGHSRALNLSLFTFNATGSKLSNSTTVLEVTNGTLGSFSSSSLNISNGGANTTTELRLPASATLRHNELQVGTFSPPSAAATVTSRVRIGTQANFNLQNLRVGEAGASARLDALEPNSTLRLRDYNGTTAMSSIMVGNFYNNLSAGADAVVDLSDGVVDIQTGSLYVGNGAPTFPATARFRFGAGTLEAGNITIGSGSSAVPSNFDYQVEQVGGTSRIVGALSFAAGNATGNATSRYTLSGGHIYVRQISASGNFTGSLRPRFEWKGGTLHNYPLANSTVMGPTNTNTPLEILLVGPDAKYVDVETGRVVEFQAGSKLVGASPDSVLSKTGAGQLMLNCQSLDFSGSVELVAGQLRLSDRPLTAALNAGSFVWHTGTTLIHPFYSSTGVGRLVLAGPLTKAGASPSPRILEIRSPATGTHTLATYASTNLTPADFTSTGLSANQAADFTIGSSALTVSIFSSTPFATWRSAKLSSATNLGDAHDLADPDMDGRQNLLEYALGSEPLAIDSAPPATIAVDTAADRLALTFTRIADPALTYVVRAASDPAGPWFGEGAEIVFTSTGAANVAGPVTASDSVALSIQPRRFLRLFVSR